MQGVLCWRNLSKKELLTKHKNGRKTTRELAHWLKVVVDQFLIPLISICWIRPSIPITYRPAVPSRGCVTLIHYLSALFRSRRFKGKDELHLNHKFIRLLRYDLLLLVLAFYGRFQMERISKWEMRTEFECLSCILAFIVKVASQLKIILTADFGQWC